MNTLYRTQIPNKSGKIFIFSWFTFPVSIVYPQLWPPHGADLAVTPCGTLGLWLVYSFFEGRGSHTQVRISTTYHLRIQFLTGVGTPLLSKTWIFAFGLSHGVGRPKPAKVAPNSLESCWHQFFDEHGFEDPVALLSNTLWGLVPELKKTKQNFEARRH